MRIKAAVALVVLSLAVSSAVARQAVAQQTVKLNGVVLSDDGSVLPGVKIQLKGCKCSDCPNKERCDCCPASLTDNSGRFALSVLPGTYVVEASLSGFATVTKQVTVTVSASATVEIKMHASDEVHVE